MTTKRIRKLVCRRAELKRQHAELKTRLGKINRVIRALTELDRSGSGKRGPRSVVR
jgi:hypothetical protein